MPPIERLAAAEAPLSFSQERLWFLEQYEPGTATFNLPSLLRPLGRLNVGALARALAEIAQRHESLRTSFRSGPNAPVQSIAPRVEVPLPLIDLGALSEEARERADTVRAEAQAAVERARAEVHTLAARRDAITAQLGELSGVIEALAVHDEASTNGHRPPARSAAEPSTTHTDPSTPDQES